MPLPLANQTWPPKQWQEIYNVYAEHAAWYGGDLDKLAVIYASRVYSPYANNSAVANQYREEVSSLVHVPVASDIAGTSAAMLFGEHPKIKIAEAHEENAPQDAINTQDELNTMLEETGFYARLSEAADSSAGLGGVFLRINWDIDVSPYPIISAAQADNALPEFKFGKLWAVTLWEELPTDTLEVYRLVERHEQGHIYTGLYKGSTSDLGTPISLDSHPQSKGRIADVATGLDGLACVYIPNILPNRKFRGQCVGRSDYAAAESLMLSLDDVFTCLLRDIKLGMGRIIAPNEFFGLDRNNQPKLDLWQEAYLKVDAMQGTEGANHNITLSQFAIRTQEHIDAAWAYLRQIYVTAGYSPQSFGMDIQGSAESGTALTIRERKSFMTAAKKADYWRPALEYILYAAQIIYKTKLHGKITPYKSTVEMQDTVQTDLQQISASVKLIADAQAATTRTKVRMLHPDWTEEQIAEEAKEIDDKQQVDVVDPAMVGRGNNNQNNGNTK